MMFIRRSDAAAGRRPFPLLPARTASRPPRTGGDKNASADRRISVWPLVSAWGVLTVGIVLSVFFFSFVKSQIEEQAGFRFERMAYEGQEAIHRRIQSYADVIHGLAARFNTPVPVSRQQFHDYVTGLNLQTHYPGFQSINYAEHVPHERKQAFENQVRLDTSMTPDGYPGFAIKPAGERDQYTVLTFLEPMDQSAPNFGLAIAANPPVRAALEAACDTGALTSSGTLIKVNGRNPHLGLAVRLPVYRYGMPLSSVEERRAAYLGSLGAGFNVRNLMHGVLDEEKLNYVRFRLSDTGPAAGRPQAAGEVPRLLFDSHNLHPSQAPEPAGVDDDQFVARLPMVIASRTWNVEFTARKDAYILGFDRVAPWLSLATGFLLTASLFYLLYSIATSRSRALEIAREITKDLSEREANLNEAQRIARLGNWKLYPADGRMECSNETYRIFGLAPGGRPMHYRDFLARVHVDDAATVKAGFESALRSAKEFQAELRIAQNEGAPVWTQLVCRRNKENGLDGIVMDITERKLASVRAEVEHRVTRHVASATEDAQQVMPAVIEIVCTGFGWTNGVFYRMDERGKRLTQNLRWPGSSVEADAAGVSEQAARLRSTVFAQQHTDGSGSLLAAFPIQSADSLFGVIVCTVPALNQQEDAVAGVLDSIGRQVGQYFLRKSVENTLRHVAAHDSLTNLPNRCMFNQCLTQAIARDARHCAGLAVLFIDLDRFKLVNDTLGHGAGDRLLQECARRLTACTRESDIVARLGGDEFALLIERFADIGDVLTIARKVLAALVEPFTFEGQELLVGASIGISRYPHDGTDVETLLTSADTAMYRAKAEGNTYKLYSSQMDERHFQRLALEASLRHATARGELELHYQPKLDLHTGRIAGVEALLRWRHPDWNWISPADFVPVAEESGLIIEIGNWALKTACEQVRTWQQQGLPTTPIAVNLSARQFRHANLVKDICDALAASGISPEWLELEVTESMVMHNTDHAIRVLTELRAMGIQLSIDDFGTGYSSLAYLRRLPVTCVKVDRFFIKDIPQEADDMAMTLGIIGLGHSLRLKVIAEGVETDEQLQFLKMNGCDQIQGFYFCKPMCGEDITPLLQHNHDSVERGVSNRRTSLSCGV